MSTVNYHINKNNNNDNIYSKITHVSVYQKLNKHVDVNNNIYIYIYIYIK